MLFISQKANCNNVAALIIIKKYTCSWSDEARFEGSHPDWVTDSGRYLIKMVHNCSSNSQIGIILVAKCSYCICLQLVSAMLPCIHTRNSHIDVLKFGDMF